MSATEIQRRQKEMFVYILRFVERAPGLDVTFLPHPMPSSWSTDESVKDDAADGPADDSIEELSHETIHIRQKIDGKALRIDLSSINGMLPRYDQGGEEFIQVNFEAGHKILITKNLIGFKPVLLNGLEKAGLPNVVTTPDILNVLDAIHDAAVAAKNAEADIKSLKRVFEAVILGGELVGFDLATERSWLKQFPIFSPKTSA